jgi:O-antigen ligase
VAQLAGIPVLAIALWRLIDRPPSRSALWPLLILAAAAALPLLQLVPLPPTLWSALPGRQTVVDGYHAAGIALPWLPLSLTPDNTWDAFLWLAPPAAMFCAVVTLGARPRDLLARTVIALALVSVAMGMLQMVGGEGAPWGLYGNPTGDSAAGFFANQDHFASFLLTPIPFAAYFVARSSLDDGQRASFSIIVMGFFAVAIVVGVAATRSRAGAALLLPMAIGAIAIATRGPARSGPSRGRWIAPAALFGAIATGVVLVVMFSLAPLAQRFLASDTPDPRFQFYPVVAAAARAYTPVGSGMGSFDTAYRMLARPETLTQAYVNHAHNEYLEIWLEAGWPGLALIGAFLTWWIAASVAILRQSRTPETALALAGAVVVGLLLAHSTVDYPLRTPALATVLALACGVMVRVPGSPAGRAARA